MGVSGVLLVRIAAIPDAMHRDGIGCFIEEHTVVAYTEPEEAFVLSREPLNASVSGFGVTVQRFENAKGGLLRDGSEFGRRVRLEPDSLHALFIRLGCRGSDPS